MFRKFLFACFTGKLSLGNAVSGSFVASQFVARASCTPPCAAANAATAALRAEESRKRPCPVLLQKNSIASHTFWWAAHASLAVSTHLCCFLLGAPGSQSGHQWASSRVRSDTCFLWLQWALGHAIRIGCSPHSNRRHILCCLCPPSLREPPHSQ